MRIVSPGEKGNLIGEYGETIVPPIGWIFLPAGDAGLTRKVTSNGEYWKVQYKKGRRTISKGIWAPEKTINQAKQQIVAVRASDVYKKKRISELKRRERKQEAYDAEFCQAVENYLCFNDRYKEMEKKLARAVTEHAIPVGSGTVARTQLIPIEERAARAVIAWMRHQTTSYDSLKIARIKGERRAIRQEFARQSVSILTNYRIGKDLLENCPLFIAINKI